MDSKNIVSIGMTLEKLKDLFKEDSICLGKEEDKVVILRAQNISGLDGKWYYRFNLDKKLDFIHFDKYYSDPPFPFIKSNFDRCLKGTKELIESYSILFGKPNSLIINDTLFDTEGRAQGYKIMKCVWSDVNGMSIKIEFISNGGWNPWGGFYYLVHVDQVPKSSNYFF